MGRQGIGYGGRGEASNGLVFDASQETQLLWQCMDTWQQSSRCCPPGCGDRCGLVVMNQQGSGHCRNVLFERCSKHGGYGHDQLIQCYTSGGNIDCLLLCGYSIRNGQLRLNSGTFNG